MADRIVVMRDGYVEQIGSPLELYDRPANLFVAGFIGSPGMNLIRGKISSTGPLEFVADGGARLPLPAGLDVARGAEIVYGIRPENIAIGEGGIDAEVVVVEPTGAETLIVSRIGADDLVIALRERVSTRAGGHLSLLPDLGRLHLFDGATGQRLR